MLKLRTIYSTTLSNTNDIVKNILKKVYPFESAIGNIIVGEDVDVRGLKYWRIMYLEECEED